MKDTKTNMVFDDYTENEPENEYSCTHWTQLCESHAVHSDPSLQEMPNEGPFKYYGSICGVKGCANEAIYYYDFNGK